MHGAFPQQGCSAGSWAWGFIPLDGLRGRQEQAGPAFPEPKCFAKLLNLGFAVREPRHGPPARAGLGAGLEAAHCGAPALTSLSPAAEPCPLEETVLRCQNPDCTGERRAAKVGPAGWWAAPGSCLLPAPGIGLAGEKGQQEALPDLPLPEAPLAWPAAPRQPCAPQPVLGMHSLVVLRSCRHLTVRRQLAPFP